MFLVPNLAQYESLYNKFEIMGNLYHSVLFFLLITYAFFEVNLKDQLSHFGLAQSQYSDSSWIIVKDASALLGRQSESVLCNNNQLNMRSPYNGRTI